MHSGEPKDGVRHRAAEMMGKHYGLFTDRTETVVTERSAAEMLAYRAITASVLTILVEKLYVITTNAARYIGVGADAVSCAINVTIDAIG